MSTASRRPSWGFFSLYCQLCFLSSRLVLVLLLLASWGVQLDESTSSFANPKSQGNSWAPCGFAVEQISAEGDGTTYGSCLACSPTNFVCPPKCQSLIDALYKQCDGVYAPQDLYFDPSKTLNGYWNDYMDVLRVKAARCGCSGGMPVIPTSRSMATTLLLLISSSFLLL
uniref:Uncharacterized protein n=1 Tax=Globisporangium ultimum (strain ATCC 200006 / CBS 805.95 / DAOM BR144) TaxID=431595 RepID=K3WC52_GLOUD